MSMHQPFTRRPCENRKPTVLRCYQSQGILLILNKLRSRQMPGSSEFKRVDYGGNSADDRFRHNYLLNKRTSIPTSYFGAKGQQLILLVNQRDTVDSSQSRKRVYRVNKSFLPR